ncbi:hypothetical protein H2204_008432 [Knufia peltigerae]|uniref:U6 small nuclear RNA (adenine-(43)-N(6))-methyltransferase n=1 Tax=Knufia peltigerae TaxID=1002370 RepID=A0AA39CWX1_9EURO|nr:hypothetical protein H2204_008432 [Knufia peltigerae]
MYTTAPNFHQGFDPDRQVIGLDMSKWLFLCTEIDDKNQKFARKNIAANKLQSRIRQIDTDKTGRKLIPTDELERFDRIDILMTNPPFYESEGSMVESSRLKSRPANSSCTGSPVEMITPGGEVAFVTKLIDESGDPKSRSRIQWSSAMLGKLSSVGSVVDHLRSRSCTNHAVAEFVQGQKTRRWCVAWSWSGLRPSNSVARGGFGSGGGVGGVEKKYLPPPTEVQVDLPSHDPVDVETRMNTEISRLRQDGGVMWKYNPARKVGMLMSKEGDVWSRKARRKRLHDRMDENQDQEMKDVCTTTPADGASDVEDDSNDDDEDEDETPEPALVVRICLSTTSSSSSSPEHHSPTKKITSTNLHIRHLQGSDSVLFESFCGWVKRKVQAS